VNMICISSAKRKGKQGVWETKEGDKKYEHRVTREERFRVTEVGKSTREGDARRDLLGKNKTRKYLT